MTIAQASRGVYRLDTTVIFALLTVLILSSMLALFQYRRQVAGSDIQIKFPAVNNFAKYPIQFTCLGAGNNSCIWSFDDKTFSNDTGNTVSHIFDHPGEYMVSVIVDNRFAQHQLIKIEKRAEIARQRVLPRISYTPQVIMAGTTVKFIDNNPLVDSWTWDFGDGGNVVTKTNSVTRRFSTPGEKTIRLFVNNDTQNDTSFTITVNIPEEPEFAPAYTTEQLQDLLREVNKGNKVVDDLAIYINSSPDIIWVDYQEKSKKLVVFKKTKKSNNISLSEACKRLAKAGNVKDISIMNLRHDKFNFITGMNIIVSK